MSKAQKLTRNRLGLLCFLTWISEKHPEILEAFVMDIDYRKQWVRKIFPQKVKA